MKKGKAAFFDRDGTLIKDVGYLTDLSQISIIPAAIRLCLKYQTLGYKLFIVTNQSGVARGYFDERFVQKVNKHIIDLFAAVKVPFQACYFCPHHPTEAKISLYKKQCFCRKPKPGMLFMAAEEHKINLSESLIFGDKQSDIDAGTAAGCKGYLICF